MTIFMLLLNLVGIGINIHTIHTILTASTVLSPWLLIVPVALIILQASFVFAYASALVPKIS